MISRDHSILVVIVTISKSFMTQIIKNQKIKLMTLFIVCSKMNSHFCGVKWKTTHNEIDVMGPIGLYPIKWMYNGNKKRRKNNW